MRLGEPRVERLRDYLADALDGFELLDGVPRLVCENVERVVAVGEVASRLLAYVADAERVDDRAERAALRLFYRRDEVLRRLVAHPVERRELFFLERIYVRVVREQPLLHELADELRTEARYVHR